MEPTTWELQLPNAMQQTDGTWTKKVVLSEMLGEDEDILVDTTRAPGGKGTFLKSGSTRISEILSRVTVSVGEETRPEGKDRFKLPDFFKRLWDAAFSSDRAFAMVRLRQLTLGNKYTFGESCPSCKKEIKRISVDLEELEVRDVKLDLASQVTHEVVLPRSGQRVEWRFLRGTDEDAVEELMKTHKDEFISCVMHRRISQVDGGPVPEGIDYLRRMSTRDRSYLRMHFDEIEGGIDTDIQVTCDNCSTEFSQKLQMMGRSSFFFPSEEPKGISTAAPLLKPGDSPPTLSAGSQ